MIIPGALAPGNSLFCIKQGLNFLAVAFTLLVTIKTVLTPNLTPMLTPILAKKYAKMW